MFVCFGCGAYGTRKTNLLKGVCTARPGGRLPEGRARVLRRVEKGLHPSDKSYLKDIRLE